MDINLPDVLYEMQTAFSRREDALVHNKVEVLDELLQSSEHTVRYGAAESLVGIAVRRDGSPKVGRQSQTWVRLPEAWRVVAAHVSVIPDAASATFRA